MKILYYSSPSFADCDFPLVKEFIRLGHEVAYLINLTPYSLKSTLFNIEKQLPVNDIIPASSYRELDVYSNYMDMSKVYIVNRTAVKDSSLQNLSITLKLISFIKKEILMLFIQTASFVFMIYCFINLKINWCKRFMTHLFILVKVLIKVLFLEK